MTWFVESAWPSIVLGLSAEAILAVLLVRTRRGNIVGAMVAVATATVGLMVIERLVVTDNEEIEEMLDGLTRALLANDVQGVVKMFTTDSPQMNEVQEILSHVTVGQARIGDLEICVDKRSFPMSATAHFTERVDARDNRGVMPYERIIRKLKVTLHKEGGHWLLYKYTDSDADNTVPFNTLNADRDHGEPILRLEENVEEARWVLDQLPVLGINISDVARQA